MSSAVKKQISGQCREFDLLAPPKHKRIELGFASPLQLQDAFGFAQGKVPGGLASPETVAKVIARNPESVFLFWRRGEIVGIYATLMLNPLGLERLLLGELNTATPELSCLAGQAAPPAAIYNWVVIAPGLAAEGIQHVSQFLQGEKYCRTNLFSWPNTPEGVAVNERLGFTPVRCAAEGLYRYTRLSNRTPQLQHAA